MGRLRNNAFVISLGTLLISGILLIVVLGSIRRRVIYLLFGTEASVGDVLSSLMIPYLPIVAVLFVIIVISALALGREILSGVSTRQRKLLGTGAALVERKYPKLGGLSNYVASLDHSPEEALDDLKHRYVAGELDEAEFERKRDHLVENTSIDSVRAARECEAVLNKRSGDSS